MSRGKDEFLQSFGDPRLDCPDWLWTRLAAAYGEAGARAIVAMHQLPAPLDLTARSDPAGVVLGSSLWFSTLGVGSRRLAPFFARPRSWQVLDAGIAVVMVSIGVGLIVGG